MLGWFGVVMDLGTGLVCEGGAAGVLFTTMMSMVAGVLACYSNALSKEVCLKKTLLPAFSSQGMSVFFFLAFE